MPMYPAHGSRGALAALVAANVAFAFQQTAVLPALPIVSRDLGAPTTWTAWLLSGYLLAASVATPLLGKLADQRGKRRVLLMSMLLFLVGSVGAAVAPTIGVLIGFRTVQGAGGAIFPISLAIARDTARDVSLGPAVGLLTGVFGLGTALGFGLGGFLAHAVSWRLVFLVGAVTVAACTWLVALFVPGSVTTEHGRLDLPGGVSLGGGFAALLLALTLGVSAGWGSWPVAALFAATTLFLAAWARRELRTPEPFIDVALLRSPTILLANLATLVLGYALFGTFFLIPHLVDSSGGRLSFGIAATAAMAGLYLVPASVGQLLGGTVVGGLARRFPPKWSYTAGMAAAAGGTASLAVWHQLPWQVLTATFALGLGLGLAVGSGNVLVTECVRSGETGVSTALNTTLRRVGGGIGSQVAAVLLATLAATSAGSPGRCAFVVSFAVAAALCIVGACLTSLIPATRP